MKAIYKNEISTYFTTLIGYIAVAFILLFAGIFTSVLCLKRGSTMFEYVIYNMRIVFLIIVPILTMRCFAEERKQRTEALLYASPVTSTDIALGKYFALLTVLAIPLALICVLPLFLSLFGHINLKAAYVAIGGFFILGAALLSIGMFLSSITEIQVLSAGLCFIILLVNFYLGSLASFVNTVAWVSLIVLLALSVLLGLIVGLLVKNWIPGVAVGAVSAGVVALIYFLKPTAYTNLCMVALRDIALFDRVDSILYGVLNLGDMLFLVSCAAIFVFLTVQSIEKRRWS